MQLASNNALKILMSLVFYPRGGSAHVVRYLSQALIDLGHHVHLVVGSLHDDDPQHNAKVFYQNLPMTEVNYTEALHGFRKGFNPISNKWPVPFHPSYEDKPGVPDRVFYKVNQAELANLVRCWQKLLVDVSQRFQPDVMHLHHLNHMHIAAEKITSILKVVHLHGTEIKMWENMMYLQNKDNRHYKLIDFWRERLLKTSTYINHYFAISPDVRQRAMKHFLLQENEITTIPNGVDLSIFRPLHWTGKQKLAFLKKILVEEPQGWDESGLIGSIRYSHTDLKKFRTPTGKLKILLMFVGRFLDFKRVPLLLEAVANVNKMFIHNSQELPFNLLIWGGIPGEWEGVHPYTLARRLALPNVFFCGWLPHDILSQGLNLADVFVAPSYYEPFGQVFLEAMATGLPVIATRSGGPLSFVVDVGEQANGWLCEIDNVDSLAKIIYEAITHETERKRRGTRALTLVQNNYSWTSIAKKYVSVYRRLMSEIPVDL